MTAVIPQARRLWRGPEARLLPERRRLRFVEGLRGRFHQRRAPDRLGFDAVGSSRDAPREPSPLRRSAPRKAGAKGIPMARSRLALALLLLAAVGLPPRADAQGNPAEAVGAAASPEAGPAEAGEPETPRLVRTAQHIQLQLAGLRAENGELNDLIQRAEGEDRRVLEKQSTDLKLQFVVLIDRLVANLLEQEAQGLDTTGLRSEVEETITALTPTIVRHLESAEQVVAELLRERETLSPEALLAHDQRLEREMSWLTSLYRVYTENVLQREAIGLPDEATRDDLVARLTRRASQEAGRLRLLTEQLAELDARVAEEPEDAALKKQRAALVVRQASVQGSVASLVRFMDRLALDASEYQRLLIISTGEVTADIFKPKVAMGLVQTWVEGVRQWWTERGSSIVFKAIIFTLIVLFSWVLSLVTRRILRLLFGSPRFRISLLLRNMLISILSNAVVFVGVLVGLSQVGVSLGPLLAGLGIAGFIVGFALQDLLANFAAGMMILAYRPFDEEDLVEAAGVFGRVSHMSLVNTTILTFDNQTLIVPNGKIWGDVIKNVTSQSERRVDMSFRISYGDDVDRAERILKQIVAAHERVLESPEPMVRLHELGENGVVFVVRPWAETGDYWDVYWDVTREVKRRFDAEGITIPLPQRVVTVQSPARRHADGAPE